MTGARARPVVTEKMSLCRFRRQEPLGAASVPDGRDSSWRFDVGGLPQGPALVHHARTTMAA